MFLLFALGCVIDRTGQSASHALKETLADHSNRVRDLESSSEDIGRRLGQLEEVTRARGQDEILKMETMEQLRQEVANMRGELDQLNHDYQDYEKSGLGFQTDADSRLLYLDARVSAAEKSLGLKPPPMNAAVTTTTTTTPSTTPSTGTATTTATTPPTPPTTTPDAGTATDTEAASTPDEYFGLITSHLQDGQNEAARAVAKRFITENPKNDRVPEAYYRIAESYQNGNDYKSAASAFQDVIDKYPKSTWAPWAMLRQGECFDGLGMPDQAKLFYCSVVKTYGTSKAAKEAKPKCSG